MSTFMLCFATIAMMAIGFTAIAVILGIAMLDVSNLLQSRGGIDKSKHRQSTTKYEDLCQ